MSSELFLSTRRAATIAGIHPHVLLNHLRRHGHWRGVTPHKLPNGRHAWSAEAVYQALGKLPAISRTDPPTRLRKLLCDRNPHLDPWQAQGFAETLTTEEPTGDSVTARTDALLLDLRLMADTLAALMHRAHAVMHDEDAIDSDRHRLLKIAGEDLTHAAENLARPVAWRGTDLGSQS